MTDSKNFADSRIFKAIAFGGVTVIAVAIAIAAARWTFAHGYVLYYGDAESHFDIARRILDSRTPGVEQIGTGWLPLLHIVLIPFVMHGNWWQTGFAGTVPSAACFAIAGVFLFAAAERAFRSQPAAFAVMLVFLLNPNMLYLSATPMTEPVFAACVAALLFATLWYRDSQSIWALLLAAAASNAASLTRYEGWFLIPFAALYILIVAKNKWLAILFGALASLAPLAWIAHNRFYEGDPLEFYRGQWSALGIYRQQLAQGMIPYPGDHDWRKAVEYFSTAVQLVVGWPALILGAAGIFAALWKRAWWAVLLLALSPVFYVMGMHSTGNPIFVPTLYPHQWYNTRYGLAALPLVAVCAGALVALMPNQKWGWPAALIVAAIPAVAWARHPESICWKESEVNSIARRQWTKQAASFLAANYQHDDGIIFPFGDMTGVLREAGIPIREGLYDGNGAQFGMALDRPDLFLQPRWALAFSGDRIATAILRGAKHGPHYQLVATIIVKGAPVVEIYHRDRGAVRPPPVCQEYIGHTCAPREEPAIR
jgi:4-amino-4-deoxy-L-arabinose transferase-like glycosyltransferase